MSVDIIFYVETKKKVDMVYALTFHMYFIPWHFIECEKWSLRTNKML